MENVISFFKAMFDSLPVIIGYIAAIVTIATSVVGLVQAIKEKNICKIKEKMMELIKQAEEFRCKNGEAVDGLLKKEIVMGKLKVVCAKFHVKFDEEFWSNAIDNYVEFTLKVNQRDKDLNKIEAPVEEGGNNENV